jgi:hypothetical protein
MEEELSFARKTFATICSNLRDCFRHNANEDGIGKFDPDFQDFTI